MKGSMAMKKSLRALMTAILIAILLPSAGFAHVIWINATDFSPAFHQKFGAATKIYFGYGHRYPVDDFLPADHLSEFVLIGPDGGKNSVEVDNKAGFLETRITFKQPGQYIVAASLRPGFYTMYTAGNEIRHKLGPKTGLEAVIVSQYFEQYTKSLINVGEASSESFLSPVGHRMEIVPLSNPYSLRGNLGDTMDVKVLLNGKPPKFCDVFATYNGFSNTDDFAFAGKTDANGIANIRLTHWGNWLVKATMKVPPTAEMHDQCNDMHYTATLTFEID
jgi:uncharacterized GH25 family protein